MGYPMPWMYQLLWIWLGWVWMQVEIYSLIPLWTRYNGSAFYIRMIALKKGLKGYGLTPIDC